MTTCPAGHETEATDYCDVCGLAVVDAAAGEVPADEGGSSAADSGTASADGACPHCGATNPANALFCEACGYDFTTGAMPRQSDPLDTRVVSLEGDDADQTPGGADDAAAPASTTGDANPSPPVEEGWVAEVWIDPDWYADQQSSDPLPSPGLPTVAPLRHASLLIGRRSRSRGISPDIDLSSDNGVSRRHAQLTTDGSRWWVEDLGSANGTYLGDPVGPLPADPIPAGRKTEIAPGRRVYVGAWTRIVVRRAAPGEG